MVRGIFTTAVRHLMNRKMCVGFDRLTAKTQIAADQDNYLVHFTMHPRRCCDMNSPSSILSLAFQAHHLLLLRPTTRKSMPANNMCMVSRHFQMMTTRSPNLHRADLSTVVIGIGVQPPGSSRRYPQAKSISMPKGSPYRYHCCMLS
jgi:hypothetical protein